MEPMEFTEHLRPLMAPHVRAMLEHPFNTELAQGVLSRERFHYYLVQDALYLVEFARTLAIIAAKAPTGTLVWQFSEAAREAIVVERALHESFFRDFGVPMAQVEASAPSPACLMYTRFLLATAHQEPYEVALAAVLPCFWVYYDVAQEILKRAVEPNPFERWFTTYADPAFGEAVALVKNAVNAAAETASPLVKTAMQETFLRATSLEWMFWDAAYRMETWPTFRR